MSRIVPLCRVLLLLSLLSIVIVHGGPPVSVRNTATVRIGINYVVIIVMENEGVGQTYGCGPDCSFISSFASNNSLARNYYSKWCSSLPNYLILLGGNDFSNSQCTSCSPQSCPSIWPIRQQNVVDRVESSGRTWKAYMEDYRGSGSGTGFSSGGCFLQSYQKYVSWHNPFIYFEDIENSTSRCSGIVRANTLNTTASPEVDDIFLTDLQQTSTASNLMWLVPNNCDNMHDLCFSTSRVLQGDTYLSKIVPKILESPLFKTGEAALFVTWDEGACGTCSQQLTAIWSGPVIKSHYCNCSTAQYYDHSSFPRTLEAIWHLQSLGHLDATAPAMTEFFL